MPFVEIKSEVAQESVGLGSGTAPQAFKGPLQALQERFAVLDLGGELRLIDREQVQSYFDGERSGELSMYKKEAGDMKMKRYLEGLPLPVDARKLVGEFWTSPITQWYDSTAFTPRETPSTTLNFWVGPTAKAKAGRWVVLRDYLRDVLCDGDEVVFDYLIKYLAHMVQRPGEKPGVMVVLLGDQGSGKGMFFNLLRSLWEQSAVLVSDINHVTGQFNALLERNYVIFLDEAVFAGDRRALDRLKSTVTETRIQIEQKYQPSRTIESVHRFFAASNHEQFAHVEKSDRRFVFLRVSNIHLQDTTYFGQIAQAIADPVTMGALLYYLKRKDISHFNVRARPKTAEHLAQKLLSLEGVERWWYEVLMSGSLTGHDGGVAGTLEPFPVKWSDPMFVGTDWLVLKYKDFDKNAGRYKTVQAKAIQTQLTKLCPSAQKGRHRCGDVGGESLQLRGIGLPTLASARRDFERVMGGWVDWDD